MTGVPYTFSAATAPIPLSQLDANFNTTLTIGGTSIGLGNTTSSLANVTFTGTTTLPGSGAISSAGLLGIGMTPSNILDITQNQNAASISAILNNSAGAASQAVFEALNGTSIALFGVHGTGFTPTAMGKADGAYVYGNGAGGLAVYTGAAQPIYFGINNAEVARFNASGRLLVNTTTANNARQNILSTQASETGLAISDSGASASGRFLSFFINTFATETGSITDVGGTGVAFNTTSDYRLKENVQPMTGGLATVAALKPVTYDWISNGSAGEGFIAHELQAVIPDAVSGEKDAVNEDGSINAQGVDFSKIVPHLVAAIQELTARLTALETK